MSYRRYAADRIVSTLGVLALGLVVVFLIFRVAPRHADAPEEFDAYNDFFDGNVLDRFGEFWWELIGHGSLGRDLTTSESLTQPILDATLVTLALVTGALIFGIVVGGAAAALWVRHPRASWPLRLSVYVAVALSPFLLAFAIGSSGVPRGYCDLIGSKGSCGGVGDWTAHMLLPWLCLGLFFAALYARLGRELARRDRTPARIAAAKRLGRDFGVAIGLALFIEVFFRLPGLTRYAVAEGGLIFALAIAVAFDLVVNLVGAAIEPEWRTR